MADATATIERDFETLGQRLEPLMERLSELQELQQSSSDLLHSQAIQPITNPELRQSIETQGRRGLEEITALHQLLSKQRHLLRKLLGPVEKLQQIIVLLNVVRSNFAIERSRDARSESLFGNYCETLQALVAKTSKTADSIKDQTLKQIQNQDGSLAELASEQSSLAGLVGAADERLHQVLKDADHAFGQEHERSQRRSEAIAQARQTLGELIFLNQFGDIFRQRSEHVQAQLETAAENAPQSPLSSSLRKGRLRALLQVQAAHLGELVEETRTTSSQLQGALASLSEQGRVLSGSALSFDDEQAASPSAIAHSLSDAFARIHQLHGNIADTIARARSRADDLNSELDRLHQSLEPLRDLIVELSINALNATVQTAHLGDYGSSLAVLSSRVQELARNASAAADEIVSIADELKDLNDERPQAAPMNPIEDFCDWSELTSSLERAERRCFEASADFDSEIEQSHSLELALHEYRSRLSQAEEDLLELETHYARYRAVHQNVDTYTMESQRQTHHAIAASAPLAETVPAGADDGSIELF